MTGPAKPTLSIIIPAYNCSHKIDKIIQSILHQPYQDFELIIVNDYSTDDTKDVLVNLAHDQPKIKIINQPQNDGASVARNSGIKHSSGRYIVFFDADDDIKPTTITQFIAAINQDKTIELVVSGMTINNLSQDKIVSSTDVCLNRLPSQLKDEDFRLYILRLLGLDGRLYQVWNKIYQSSIIKDNHLLFQPGVNFGEDLVFNLNYLSKMTGRITFIPQALYIYNQDLDGGTFSKSSLIFSNRQKNFAELVKFMSTSPSGVTKTSLLTWIQYSWLYSHLLAISQAHLPRRDKLTKLRQLNQQFKYPKFSSPAVIGKKRVTIEKLLALLLPKPNLTLVVIGLSTRLKNSYLTNHVWQQLRQSINR